MAELKAIFARCGIGVWCLAVACSGHTSGGTSAESIPIDQLGSELARVICASVGPCCASNGLAFDQATCLQNAETTLSANIARDEIPTIKYDANAAGNCIAVYGAAFKACGDTETAAIQAACGPVLVGTLAAGSACTIDDECNRPVPKAEVYCAKTASVGAAGGAGTATGKCVVNLPVPRANAGEPCSGDCNDISNDEGVCTASDDSSGSSAETARCYASDNLYCDATSVCKPLPALGQACAASDCVAGAFCNAGTCAAQSDTGPCSSTDACSSKSYCDFATNQCSPKLVAGVACTQNRDCQSGSCSYSSTPLAAANMSSGGSASTNGNAAIQGVCAVSAFVSAKSCQGNFD